MSVQHDAPRGVLADLVHLEGHLRVHRQFGELAALTAAEVHRAIVGDVVDGIDLRSPADDGDEAAHLARREQVPALVLVEWDDRIVGVRVVAHRVHSSGSAAVSSTSRTGFRRSGTLRRLR